MTRFPLLVEILGTLSKTSIPFPGDDDIRHGCERALTAMLAELARIEPAPTGRTSKAEDTALGLLHSLEAEKLIHPDQRQRIQQFIERILGGAAHTH
ncbi:MAG: hypothetical protein H8M99_02365 [Gloeobacteraceae cyanobacterium ES-bin-144]|nr:hypothetical protein [Verrucomicrobiales bacterium]